MAVRDKIIIFFDELNIDRNSFNPLNSNKNTNNKTKDQSPLCIATSIEGI